MKITSLKKTISYMLVTVAVLAFTASFASFSGIDTFAYNEVIVGDGSRKAEYSTLYRNQFSLDYLGWLTGKWTKDQTLDKPVLCVGKNESSLNLTWYSERSVVPAVEVSTDKSFKHSDIIKGIAMKILRNNGIHVYNYTNHVSIEDYFNDNKTFYYRTTNNINSTSPLWSTTYRYTPVVDSDFTCLVFADPQIGASGSCDSDTYSFQLNMETAYSKCNHPAFALMLGDQINTKEDSTADPAREQEYTGLFSSSHFRETPVAAAVGNHETLGVDYSYHFHNPNLTGYGKTPSGEDYYFTRGNALFIVLNSNNRKQRDHDKALSAAVSSNPNAKWRIVCFHHDIYGSGIYHSQKTSTNIRMVLAPLMDKYNIDLVMSGHDHSYCRSYSMWSGTAITDDANAGDSTVTAISSDASLVNPVGTTYITLGSSSGSKMYNLTKRRPYYVAERSNNLIPTFATLNITRDTLTLDTYDSLGIKYADTFTITKTDNESIDYDLLQKMYNTSCYPYTDDSFAYFQYNRNVFTENVNPILNDPGANIVDACYLASGDPLTYYGYDLETNSAVKEGFSRLVDKTYYADKAHYSNNQITEEEIKRLYKNLVESYYALTKR